MLQMNFGPQAGLVLRGREGRKSSRWEPEEREVMDEVEESIIGDVRLTDWSYKCTM